MGSPTPLRFHYYFITTLASMLGHVTRLITIVRTFQVVSRWFLDCQEQEKPEFTNQGLVQDLPLGTARMNLSPHYNTTYHSYRPERVRSFQVSCTLATDTKRFLSHRRSCIIRSLPTLYSSSILYFPYSLIVG